MKNTTTAVLTEEVKANQRGYEIWALPGREVTITEQDLERAAAGEVVRVELGRGSFAMVAFNQIAVVD